MMKRKVNLSSVNGWAGNAAGAFNAHTVTVDCPVGPRYHAIWIYGHAGAAKKFTDLIGEVRILINGTPQRTFTGVELLKLNALNNEPNATLAFAGRNGNVANTAFQIPIWFAEPWRKSLRSQDALAWGTGDVGAFQIQLDIQAYAGAAAGLIAPTFKAEIDNVLGADGKPQKLGIFTKWKKLQIPITAANAFNDYLGLGTSIRDTNAIQSLHLSDANVAEFELLVNENMYRKDTTAGNAANLASRGMSPDPTATNDCPARAMYDLVMDHDDVLENVLPLAINGQEAAINLRLNESGGTVARNISTIVQLIGAAE